MSEDIILNNITNFSNKIEELAKKVGYIDALVHYAEEYDIDFNTMAGLVSQSLKEKVRKEAISLNMMKKQISLLDYV